MSIKMIGYTRVSTTGQADNGHSLAAQRAAITSAAEQHGWEIAWAEDAASGKNTDRPGLQYALNLLKAGQAQGIVATKLDRLSRSTLDFATLVALAKKQEWNIVLLDQGLDLSTKEGRFFATMLSAIAELEREMASERTKEGLAAAKQKGIQLGGSHTKVPEELSARIQELSFEGMTLAEIANMLTQEGVPLPSGREGVWQPAQVSRVLKRAQNAT